jgi:hypothetical protein
MGLDPMHLARHPGRRVREEQVVHVGDVGEPMCIFLVFQHVLYFELVFRTSVEKKRTVQILYRVEVMSPHFCEVSGQVVPYLSEDLEGLCPDLQPKLLDGPLLHDQSSCPCDPLEVGVGVPPIPF